MQTKGNKWFKMPTEICCFYWWYFMHDMTLTWRCIVCSQYGCLPWCRNVTRSYSISDTSGFRSLQMTSDSMRLQRAAYGLSITACCCANLLPSSAARVKSLRASSAWLPSRNSSPLCTRAWHAVRPAPPLRAMARSRSRIAPGTEKESPSAEVSTSGPES